MGLLSRASTLDSEPELPGLAFSDFINRYSLKFCAVLESKDSDYFIQNSIGFDARSIISSISTADFWKGICPEKSKLYTFKGTDTSPLLQLFSFALKDFVKEISVYKNSSSKILICSGILSDKACEDFERVTNEEHIPDVLTLNPFVKDGSVVLLFKLNLSDAVRTFYEEEYITSSDDSEYFYNAVTNEITNRLSCIYNLPDSTVKAGTNTIKTVLVTDKTYSPALIKHHIILNLKEVLEKHAELIQFDFEGTADSCDAIQSFLQAE